MAPVGRGAPRRRRRVGISAHGGAMGRIGSGVWHPRTSGGASCRSWSPPTSACSETGSMLSAASMSDTSGVARTATSAGGSNWQAVEWRTRRMPSCGTVIGTGTARRSGSMSATAGDRPAHALRPLVRNVPDARTADRPQRLEGRRWAPWPVAVVARRSRALPGSRAGHAGWPSGRRRRAARSGALRRRRRTSPVGRLTSHPP
jgi:hypothetical protein